MTKQKKHIRVSKKGKRFVAGSRRIKYIKNINDNGGYASFSEKGNTITAEGTGDQMRFSTIAKKVGNKYAIASNHVDEDTRWNEVEPSLEVKQTRKNVIKDIDGSLRELSYMEYEDDDEDD